jgi:flagellin FlaB
MNFIKNRHSHRGIVGVEAAIVLIAFVLIAATLSYVVLNTGFSTTQKAKTTIGSTLTSSDSLEVEGKVIASSYSPAGGTRSLNITSIPIKIAGGGDAVNLAGTVTAVKYLSNSITYDNIYNGTLNARPTPTYNSLETATNAAATYDTSTGGKLISLSPFQGGGDADADDWPVETTSFIYWSSQVNTNDILETGEHANLAVVFASGDRPEYLDKIRVELIQSNGASLVVERTIPVIQNEVVDLG